MDPITRIKPKGPGLPLAPNAEPPVILAAPLPPCLATRNKYTHQSHTCSTAVFPSSSATVTVITPAMFPPQLLDSPICIAVCVRMTCGLLLYLSIERRVCWGMKGHRGEARPDPV